MVGAAGIQEVEMIGAKQCVILGDRSDIAIGLMRYLFDDGYRILGWNRDMKWGDLNYICPEWDLVICAIGTVAPAGRWEFCGSDEWDGAVESNLLLPLRLLRAIWHNRKRGAAVCFMAGSNPNRAGVDYSAYYTAKMGLIKAVETLDAETPEVKLFTLGPGIVLTKIHEPTYRAGVINPALEAAKRIPYGAGSVPIGRIYACLQWCVRQDKACIGGRNISVHDHWEHPQYANWLRANHDALKLRRAEGFE